MKKLRTQALDLSEIEEQQFTPPQCIQRQHAITEYNFYMYDEIGPPNLYIEMVDTIRSAGPSDRINIYLNTDGGDFATGVAILSAIDETQAVVTTILDSSACSMGALIFLAGHQHIIHKHTAIMFHTFSAGLQGKSGDIRRQVESLVKCYSGMVKDLCQKVLTPEEIKKIHAGEDLWLSGKQLAKRLNSVSKTKQSKHVRKGFLSATD